MVCVNEMVSSRAQVSLDKFTVQSPCHEDREQVFHPCAIQHPKKWFRTLQNWGILPFASYTSNWRGQMFDFRRYIRLLPTLISSPQGRKQSPSLETNPSKMLSCFTHMTILSQSLVWCMSEINIANSSATSLSPYLRLLLQVCWQPLNVWSSNSCHVRAFQN